MKKHIAAAVLGPDRTVDEWVALCLPINRADQDAALARRSSPDLPAAMHGYHSLLGDGDNRRKGWVVELWVEGAFPGDLGNQKAPLNGNHKHGI